MLLVQQRLKELPTKMFSERAAVRSRRKAADEDDARREAVGR